MEGFSISMEGEHDEIDAFIQAQDSEPEAESELDAVDAFIEAQEPKTTRYANNTAVNLLRRYFVLIKERREIENIPPIELDKLLCTFFLDVRKLDGKNFEPDSLSSTQKAIQRYLYKKKYPCNILFDDVFERSRKALAAKRKELTHVQGLGNKPNSTRELSKEEIDMLYENIFFGMETPQSLLNAVWWVLSLHSGFRARDEQRKLQWGDIVFGYDATLNLEYLEWVAERGSKTRTGKEGEQKRAFDPILWATNTDRCPVKYYKAYRAHRPASMLEPTSPFFLLINHKYASGKNSDWYRPKPMGHNLIGSIMTTARKKFNLSGKKVANHSVRKTSIGRLLDSNVPETYVAQQSGMKNVNSLQSYKAPNKEAKMRISNVLSGSSASSTITSEINTSTDEVVAEPRAQSSSTSEMNTISLSQQNSTSSSQSSRTNMFANAVFKNCVFNFGSNSPPTPPRPPKRIRLRVPGFILSSSEEEDC